MAYLINKKILYVANLHDCGKFIIIDSLKNNKDIKFNLKYTILETDISIKRVLNNDVVFPIFIFRDVRVCWLISEHKKEGNKRYYSIEKYIKKFNDFLNIYLDIKDERCSLIFKFEDFLINKRSAYKKLCNDLEIMCDYSDIPYYFHEKTSILSVYDMEKIIKFQRSVNDDQLSYISSKTKEYNKFFNYPDNLSKNDILQGLNM